MATLRDVTANPGPLGLMAFGMTTILLNIHNAGFYEMNTMILAMGIFYGGIAQVIAGIMEWKKNSTFGMTAFLSYGLFWLTLVGLIVFPMWMGVDGPDDVAMGWYLGLGIFTGLMFIGTLRINRSLRVVFFTLTILFVCSPSATGPAARPSARSPAGRASSWASALCTAPSPRCGTSSTARSSCQSARTRSSTEHQARERGLTDAEGRRHRRVTAPLLRAGSVRRSAAVRFFRPTPSLSCSLTRTRVRSTLHTNMCSPQEEERWKVSHRDRNRYWSSSARACESTLPAPTVRRSARASSRRLPSTHIWPTSSASASSGAIHQAARPRRGPVCGLSGRCRRWGVAAGIRSRREGIETSTAGFRRTTASFDRGDFDRRRHLRRRPHRRPHSPGPARIVVARSPSATTSHSQALLPRRRTVRAVPNDN
jgi:hypothetical protein